MQSIVLGTAQWGSDYGVTNAVGRLSDASLAGLASTALELGIVDLDTAPVYGDAEERISPWARSFSITTKVAASGLTPSLSQRRWLRRGSPLPRWFSPFATVSAGSGSRRFMGAWFMTGPASTHLAAAPPLRDSLQLDRSGSSRQSAFPATRPRISTAPSIRSIALMRCRGR